MPLFTRRNSDHSIVELGDLQMRGRTQKVSAVIIAFNEEADIARALASVAWCDEVLVVDSGSTDRTVEICTAHGCRVLQREFSGYGAQKAFAVAQAVNNWVLVIDADEEVSPALRDEILSKLEEAGDCHGYTLPITTVLWDGVVRTSLRHTKSKLRLFDRRFGNFQGQLVHESVLLEGPAEPLHHPMYNYSYASIHDYFGKFNEYTTLAARDRIRLGNGLGLLGTTVRLPLTFIRLYFVNGFLHDGLTGLQWSLFSSLYPVVKYFKVLELRQAKARRQLAQDFAVSSPTERPTIDRRGTLLSGRPLDWKIASAYRARPMAYVMSACCVGLALLFMNLFQWDRPVDDFMLLLAAVIAAARFCGFGPAFMATGLGMLSLDYFALPPANFFVVPDLEGLAQLSLFAAVALLSTSFVYARRRQLRR